MSKMVLVVGQDAAALAVRAAVIELAGFDTEAILITDEGLNGRMRSADCVVISHSVDAAGKRNLISKANNCRVPVVVLTRGPETFSDVDCLDSICSREELIEHVRSIVLGRNPLPDRPSEAC
jgi:D-arabinose 5-phosphate isomerase GutQ